MENWVMNLLLLLGLLLGGYLVGSIPTSLLLGKWLYKKDLRKYGSGNPGGTNAGRVFGKKIGFLVIVLDILKTALVFWASWAIARFLFPYGEGVLWLEGAYLPWAAALMASLGHCYPVWLKFKGGKGVACFMAIVGGTSWLGFLLCFLSFFLVLAIRKKVVSFSSLVSGAILLLFEIILGGVALGTGWDGGILTWTFGLLPGGLSFGWWSLGAAFLAYLVLVIRHIPNIKRLRAGTEKAADWSTREVDRI